MKSSYDVGFGVPSVTIIKESLDLKRDLIIMGTEGHKRLHYFLFGRVIYGVLNLINKDILLVPPKKK